MCTPIVIHRRIPGSPLIVAANRDEYLDRPAAAPACMEHPDGGTILAPRDLRAGGTWLGLNQHGVFAAITNRPSPKPAASRRSRGLLVLDALAYATAAQAAAKFESLGPDLYNPFNWLVADSNDGFAVVSHDGQLRVDQLEPGVHVIGNAEPNDLSHAKTRRTLATVRSLVDESTGTAAREPLLAGLGELCRSHDGISETAEPLAPLGAICVHHEGYGTRSSTLLQLSGDPQQSELYYSDGAPCVNPYENLTPLLHELSRTASYDGTGTTAREAS